MIECEFGDAEGAEAVRFPHSDFCFVVESLDYAAGELLASAEVVEDEFAVGAQGSGDFLHRFDPRAHHLAAPMIQEFGCPCSGFVIPELLEVFLEEMNGLRGHFLLSARREPAAIGRPHYAAASHFPRAETV